eukprot:CAMPEP_0172530318 /NCGR_PEP_ID=MMETSP1067-20121228/4086_1 /TAXON_ID=265564 ORGANISM="Thalassiosira punctigera, Strain Tpunct2005C2" /NCGR_SAMPLE_ID=MMETSP1067 /ASSEMBLY_ACC=CAM_ASM_000444 /LENGTH=63 /DNA_ID=CAMNT_0013314497 /DNA_START=75 /DNA_END=266 /DNA_ORIENTATION=-
MMRICARNTDLGCLTSGVNQPKSVPGGARVRTGHSSKDAEVLAWLPLAPVPALGPNIVALKSV